LIQNKVKTDVPTIERVVRRASQADRPSLPEVARMMDVSPRSLQRLLCEQGTTFSRIVESSRRQSAFQLLVRDDLSVSEVAERLGYSDPSNFGRAFRKWTGQSPNQWRKRALRQDIIRHSTA
jgi:AraC-like DNA-binding protein